MIKIIAFNRKERFMRKIFEATKFVAACLLTPVIPIMVILGVIVVTIAHYTRITIKWLSPDVDNIMETTKESIEDRLLSYLYD